MQISFIVSHLQHGHCEHTITLLFLATERERQLTTARASKIPIYSLDANLFRLYMCILDARAVVN